MEVFIGLFFVGFVIFIGIRWYEGSKNKRSGSGGVDIPGEKPDQKPR